MKSNSKRGLLSNDFTLFIISIVLAFVIWFVINANSQTESNVTISNIPITIELSQDAIEDGMQVFDGADTTASVEVSGNRITVGSLSASDIQVVALQSNSIIAPGSHTLELSAKKVGVKTNYNFASNVSPSTVTVYVDKLKEKNFDIVDHIVYKVEEGYYANTSLSESTVKLSGPETEISAIDSVVVQGTLEGKTNATTTDEFELVYLDKDGNELDIKMSQSDIGTVDVSVTPIPTTEINLELDVVDAPAKYPKVKLSPSTIKIAAEQSVIDSIEDGVVNIGTLDFSTLLNKKNIIEYDITLPIGCKNLSDTTVAKASIDLSDYKQTNVDITGFRSENVNLSQYNVVYNNSSMNIVVCGEEELISEITSANIIAKVDFTGKLEDFDKKSISLELPVKFEFTNAYKNCWVYGDYTVNVNVTKK